MLGCGHGGRNDFFQYVPLPFFLKVSEGAESVRVVLGLLFGAKLNFDFVLLDADDFSRSRPELLAKRFL